MDVKNVLQKSFVCMIVVIGVLLITGCPPDIVSPPKPVIPETTKVLDQADVENASVISEDRSVIQFSEKSGRTASLKPGDVIVAGVSDKTPQGMLRKVVSVEEDENGITVRTTEAKLEEAIENCDIQYEAELTEDDLIGEVVPAEDTEIIIGGRSRADIGLGALDITYKRNLSSYAKIDGKVSLNPRLHVAIVIEWFVVKKVEAYIVVEENASLTFTASYEKTVEKDVDLCSCKWGPYTIWIGPLPVVISPQIVLKAGVDASLSASLTTGVQQHANLTLGTSCNGDVVIPGNWRPVYSFTNDFSYTPPTLSASASLSAWVGPRFAVWIYELVVPWIEPHLYVQLDADISANPWWKLYAGLDAAVGIDLRDKELVKWEKIIDLKKDIASANGTAVPTDPPPVVTNPPVITTPPSPPTNPPTPSGTWEEFCPYSWYDNVQGTSASGYHNCGVHRAEVSGSNGTCDLHFEMTGGNSYKAGFEYYIGGYGGGTFSYPGNSISVCSTTHQTATVEWIGGNCTLSGGGGPGAAVLENLHFYRLVP